MEKPMTITLTGEPKSTNNIYKYHCKFGFPSGYMSEDGRWLKSNYQLQAKSQWKKIVSVTKDFSVIIRLYFSRASKHDIDNYGKILLDSLTGIVWDDDSQIQVMKVSKFKDKENPRIEIEIEEINANV